MKRPENVPRKAVPLKSCPNSQIRIPRITANQLLVARRPAIPRNPDDGPILAVNFGLETGQRVVFPASTPDGFGFPTPQPQSILLI
jgi:hypothetical protein